ncbi:hypothetical protein [Microvirga puerhi]|uniref:Uncharacterized protein n=1 Tax=Microvirga puerhi TaxID=2876078 RepID=A0ABS7VVR0_9HYPH|nr:hypothetical protein [Microvirga puerhi]MBZ6078953.1 hypothetical protein [Microvirga puerhi]
MIPRPVKDAGSLALTGICTTIAAVLVAEILWIVASIATGRVDRLAPRDLAFPVVMTLYFAWPVTLGVLPAVSEISQSCNTWLLPVVGAAGIAARVVERDPSPLMLSWLPAIMTAVLIGAGAGWAAGRFQALWPCQRDEAGS